ncbi:MAG: YggS family pyridoxal phosphate-dependent enzyme [Cyanobium sp.]
MPATPSNRAPAQESPHPGGAQGPHSPRGAAGPGALEHNLAELRHQLPPGCRLLAVSKGQPAEMMRRAVAAGQRSFGESRLQEAIAKQEQLADLGPLDWHFIGRLQANKARGVLRHFGTIHSLDSLALAERLARIAAEEGLAPQVFLQVKLRPDPGKTGFERADLLACWPRLAALAPLRPVGLMLIPPLGLSAEDRCALFAEGAALAKDLALAELSMGMSGDWREAAAAGSTWVRLGTALFGDRPAPGAGSGTDSATTTP